MARDLVVALALAGALGGCGKESRTESLPLFADRLAPGVDLRIVTDLGPQALARDLLDGLWRAQSHVRATIELWDSRRNPNPWEPHADLLILSQNLSRELLQRLEEQLDGEPIVLKAGFDSVSVVVHDGNPLASCTLSHLRSAFAVNGRARRWSDLGSDDESLLRLYAPEAPGRGTYGLFRDLVAPAGLRAVETVAERKVAANVARDRLGLGFCRYGMGQRGVKVLALATDGKKPVDPTAAHIRKGTYPLSRPVHVVLRPNATAAARTFGRFVLSREGQRVVASNGFTTITVASARRMMRALTGPDASESPSK